DSSGRSPCCIRGAGCSSGCVEKRSRAADTFLLGVSRPDSSRRLPGSAGAVVLAEIAALDATHVPDHRRGNSPAWSLGSDHFGFPLAAAAVLSRPGRGGAEPGE